MSYFEHAGHRADEETAEYLLSSYQWNIDQTLLYSQDLVQAVQGTLLPVQGETALSGAVNDQMTSCYIGKSTLVMVQSMRERDKAFIRIKVFCSFSSFHLANCVPSS